MFQIGLLGIASWIISGLLRDGTPWINDPPFYAVFLAPFLFATFLAFAVTVIQFRSDQSLAGRSDRESRYTKAAEWKAKLGATREKSGSAPRVAL
jgi:hypothetical protein